MSWTVKHFKRAINDSKKSPPYEKLVGDLAGKFSRRINIKHRLVYEMFER